MIHINFDIKPFNTGHQYLQTGHTPHLMAYVPRGLLAAKDIEKYLHRHKFVKILYHLFTEKSISWNKTLPGKSKTRKNRRQRIATCYGKIKEDRLMRIFCLLIWIRCLFRNLNHLIYYKAEATKSTDKKTHYNQILLLRYITGHGTNTIYIILT